MTAFSSKLENVVTVVLNEMTKRYTRLKRIDFVVNKNSKQLPSNFTIRKVQVKSQMKIHINSFA